MKWGPMVVLGLFVSWTTAAARVSVAFDPPAAEVRRAVDLLPRGFVANEGQWDERAAFAALGFYGTTWVSRDGELRHVLLSRGTCQENLGEVPGRIDRGGGRGPCASRAWVLAERFVGGQVVAMQGREELQGKVSFFLGNDPSRHRSGLATYRYLELGEVYPGVRVKLAAGQKTVEKVLELAPGADPEKVWVELVGAQGVGLGASGELVVTTGYGEVVFSAPVAWQEAEGRRVEVAVAYQVDNARRRYRFAVGDYDRSRPLWIDPILQATYLGSSGYDPAYALAVDPGTGDVYVAGYTDSINFPNTTGGAQGSHGGYSDAFVARLNAALTANPQSTYLGGDQGDVAIAVAIHPITGEVYVAGYTNSSNFPNTTGGAQGSRGGYSDAFVARLNAALTANLQSTYLGGSFYDECLTVAVHPGTGEVYIGGFTYSNDFPNTAGGAQASSGGGVDAFVARLNAALTANPQSTYLGGLNGEQAEALAISGAGDVYVAGFTYSTDFPNTAGGAQASFGGLDDVFVARLNAALTANPQSTYLGGGGEDRASALALHPSTGELYVAGLTSSNDFPNATGGAQAGNAGSFDAFVARLNAALTANPQSTYLGGSWDDLGRALAIHPLTGEVYLVGFTSSTDFPNTTGGAQANNGGQSDAFVARLNAALTANPQSTYLGGSLPEDGWAVGIHPTTGEVYVAGWTESTDVPNTTGGAQATNAGSADALVARLSADLAGPTAADMSVAFGALPSVVAPGGTYPGLGFSCTNAGPGAATNATCAVAVSAGTVSGVSCTPAVPVGSLAAGGTISCTYTFTAPGSPGGGNTPETGVTFSFTTGADNDTNGANNSVTSGATPIPLVDALDDAVSLPANTVGATYNVGANDQYGTGSLPGTANFTLLGTTTCAGASINSSGVVTFNVPASGSCVVAYRVCVVSGCDTAQLVVTAQQVEMIPTLDQWGLLGLAVLLAGAGVVLVRRITG